MAQQTSSLAIVSFVMGVLVFFVGITAPLALVFGIFALREIRNNPKMDGEGFAWAGIILGAIPFVVLFFVLLIVVFVLMAMAFVAMLG